jgi:stage II sporulation protein R
MKRRLLGIVIAGIICGGLTVGALVHERAVESYNADNLIRLHIVPNSDTAGDQVLKHRVRRAVVRAMAPEFEQVKDVRVARRLVDDNIWRIKQAAAQEVALAGADYGVSVYHGRFDFPERTYGDLTLPAGEYEAVRVVLGSGKGHNWWCVLFPPLCMVSVEAAEDSVSVLAGSTGPQQVQFRSRLWEVARRHLGLPFNQVVRSPKEPPKDKETQ